MDFLMLRVNTASDIWRLMAQTAIQPGVANIYCSVVQQSRGTASLAIADQSTCNFEGMSYRHLSFMFSSPSQSVLESYSVFATMHVYFTRPYPFCHVRFAPCLHACLFVTRCLSCQLWLLLAELLQNEQSLPAGKISSLLGMVFGIATVRSTTTPWNLCGMIDSSVDRVQACDCLTSQHICRQESAADLVV